jgi:hypothetical protein
MRRVLAVSFIAIILAFGFTFVIRSTAQNNSPDPSSQDVKDGELADEIERLTNRSPEGLVQRRTKDGTVIDLQGRYQNVMLAQASVDDSTPHAACVTSLEEANEFFGRNLRTGEPVYSTRFQREEPTLEEIAATHGMTVGELEFYKRMIAEVTSDPSFRPDAATITIQNNDGANEGFNATTAGPNDGTNTVGNLGAQRLAVFNFAAGIWGNFLDSTIPIVVASQFDPLTCTPTGAVLGSAGPNSAFRNFANAPFTNTFYPVALANKTAGADLLAGAEISATFNSTVNGTPGCLDAGGTPRRFYLGFDNATPANTTNLLVVVLHEIGHGLGSLSFVSTLNITGASNTNPITITSASHGLATGDTVTIQGATGNTAANGTFVITVTNANNFTIPAAGNGAYTGNGIIRGANLAGFPDAWSRLMFDKTTNKFWNNMTTAERAASSLNNGNLVWDGANTRIASGFLTAGRDATNGRVQLFAPATFQEGSSVSHWDTAAFPNLLMEPVITTNLPLTLDLSRQQMRDIGWFRDSNGDLTPDSITLTSQNTGSLTVGTTATVNWTNGGGFNKNVTIELSTDNGASFPVTIATDIANIGSHTFTVPNNLTATGKIRVREADFAAPAGQSSGSLSIIAGVNPDYTVTTAGNQIVVTDLSNNGDILNVTNPVAGTIRFGATGRTFSINGGAPINDASGDISLTNVTAVTINQAGGVNALQWQGTFTNFPSLTINGGAADDSVTIFNNLGFAANANLNIDLQDDVVTPGADQITVNNASNITLTGSGIATLRASRRIEIFGTLSTVNGNIIVEANQQATPTALNSTGIRVNGTVQATGTGTVTLNGKGGNASLNVGVLVLGTVRGGTSVGSTVTSVTGRGGTGANNHGVQVQGGEIGSNGGNVSVTGFAGSSGGNINYGVIAVTNGKITSGGNGSVTVQGTGGTGNGGENHGVVLYEGGGLITSAGSGAVSVTGTAGGGFGSSGVYVFKDGRITSGGSGAVSVNGTGGPQDSPGVEMNSSDNATGARINSGGGPITVTASTGASGFDLAMTGGLLQQIASTGNANVEIIANSVQIAPATSQVSAGTGQVTFRQRTNGHPIALGGVDGGQLGLTDNELDAVTAGTLIIGDVNSGPVSVTAPVTQTKTTNIAATTQTSVSGVASLGIFGTVTGPLQVAAAGSLVPGPGAGPGVINSGNLTLLAGSNLNLEIGGATPGNGAGFHDQLNVNGTVTLGGATLNVGAAGGFVPVANQQYVIINNDGGDPVSGTFAGLLQGAVLANFLGTNLNATISYTGGSGNDVVLSVAAPAPTPTATATVAPTPTATATVAPTPTATATVAPTPTATATVAPTPTATATVAPASVSGVVTYGTTPTGQGPRFVPGVMLAGAGSAATNATTNAGGSYTLTGFGSGAYTVTPAKTGDVNGSISGLDAARVAQHVAGLITLTSNQQIAGDATNNGGLSGLDAARIAQFAAGLTNPGIAGQWKFVPATRNYASVAGTIVGDNYEAILVGEVTGNWTAPIPRLMPEASLTSALGDQSTKSSVEAGTDRSGGPASVTLPNDIAARAGRAVTVPIAIGETRGKGILAYDFTFNYDPAVLTPDMSANWAARTLSEGWTVVINAEASGSVKVTAFNTAGLSGSGTLLNLAFNAVRSGRTELKWTAFELNEGQVATGLPFAVGTRSSGFSSELNPFVPRGFAAAGILTDDVLFGFE